MVFGHYVENASFVLANFAPSDRLNHSLYFLLGTIPERKSDHPVFGHSVSKLDVFCTVFKSRYFGNDCLV